MQLDRPLAHHLRPTVKHPIKPIPMRLNPEQNSTVPVQHVLIALVPARRLLLHGNRVLISVLRRGSSTLLRWSLTLGLADATAQHAAAAAADINLGASALGRCGALALAGTAARRRGAEQLVGVVVVAMAVGARAAVVVRTDTNALAVLPRRGKGAAATPTGPGTTGWSSGLLARVGTVAELFCFAELFGLAAYLAKLKFHG